MVWMKRHTRHACGALLLLALAQVANAQPARSAPEPTTAPATPAQTALDAELFYQLLLGELNARGAEPAAGYALVLDAARKTNDPALYKRAVDIAFQARNGDSALSAARASSYGARPRPLAPASTEAERARHAAFLRTMLPDMSLWARLAPDLAD